MEQTFVSGINEENRILRECRGRRLAISRSVYEILDTQINNSSSFYVKSESKDIFYFVEFKPNYIFCTCWDFASNRSEKCKHLYAVQYAIRLGLVQQIDHKLPIAQKPIQRQQKKAKSWEDDEYSF